MYFAFLVCKQQINHSETEPVHGSNYDVINLPYFHSGETDRRVTSVVVHIPS